jgi:hypothetical protein
MFGESITTVLFRLLNFAALMGLFAFLFKKYMQKGIEQSIEQERLDEINMNNHIIEVDHCSSDLSIKISNQEKLCRHLIKQADQWKVVFDKELREKKHQQHTMQLQLVDRAKRQAQAIAHERMIQAILPQALAQAQEQLEASFAHESKSKAFVTDIIRHIKKSE